MNQEKMFASFVEIEARYKAVEKEREEARKMIVATLEKEGLDKVENEKYGSFKVSSRKTYTFSKAVKLLEEKVKLAKDKEMKKGTAKVKSETTYLTYTPIAGGIAPEEE